MDKPNVERISIRINGKERIFLSDEELNLEISAAKEVEDELPEEELNHFETLAIEELVTEEPERDNIIDFEERRNGKKNNFSKSFNRDSSYFPTKQKKNHLLLNKKKRHPLLTSGGGKKVDPIVKKFIAVLISAIIIGVGFGYVVLSLFTDLSPQRGEETNAPVENVGNGQGVQQSNGATGDTSSGMVLESVGTSSVNGIAPLSVQIIQGGAFESVESANHIAASLKENGNAAVIMPKSKPVLMFIGIGADRNEATTVSQLYLKKGQDVYLKPFGLSEINEDKLSNKEEAAFVSAGINLYQSLLSLSTKAFELNKIDQATWNDVESKFSKWNGSKPQELATSLEQFANSISKTYQSLASYKIKEDEKQLWNSQQALLEGLLSYKVWHDEIVAQ